MGIECLLRSLIVLVFHLHKVERLKQLQQAVCQTIVSLVMECLALVLMLAAHVEERLDDGDGKDRKEGSLGIGSGNKLNLAIRVWGFGSTATTLVGRMQTSADPSESCRCGLDATR